MAAIIKNSEIEWAEPIHFRFGFTGLTSQYAVPIIRKIITDRWPDIRRPKQCVYIIRLKGAVSIAYGSNAQGGPNHSPVIYIGEGSAYDRLYSHANWLSELLVSVPNLEIEIRIAQISRKNHTTLYQYIEADLIKWFAESHDQRPPWFNRQRERSKEGHYTYDAEAERHLKQQISVGSGNRFLWAISPTQNNEQYEAYAKGTKL